MRILFVNPYDPHCGVYQYGLRLMGCLHSSRIHHWRYCDPQTADDFLSLCHFARPDLVVWNTHPNIPGWLQGAPLPAEGARHVAIYHDGPEPDSRFSAVLFSDPTMPQHGRWYPIGRPLPAPTTLSCPGTPLPTIGVNGFLGAWAMIAMRQILHEFHDCTINLHLPFATYGDGSGATAAATAAECVAFAALHRPRVKVNVSHDFLPTAVLVDRLASNHLNCYMRDLPPTWRGVSSVLDCALAARRPIAVNKCVAFRHVHQCKPSICIEDTPLRQILSNGIAPLQPLLEAWSPDRVREGVESALAKAFGSE